MFLPVRALAAATVCFFRSAYGWQVSTDSSAEPDARNQAGNPDFYDRTLPPWEAQSLCVSLNTGPNSKQHFLNPTIVNIWNSLDSDAIAQVLK